MPDQDDPGPAPHQLEFGTLDEANAARDDAEDLLHPTDNRSRKTVHFREMDDETRRGLEAEAAAGRAETQGSFDRVRLTDDERETLENRRGWTWQEHGFEAMYAKGALEAKGATDWLNYYEKGEGAQGAIKNLEAGKEAQAATGAGTGLAGDYVDDEDTAEEEARRLTASEGGGDCDHAEDHCRHGDAGACEFLRDECGLEDERVDALLEHATERGTIERDETPAEAPEYDAATEKVKGALSRSWGGYKGAVNDADDALEAVAEHLGHAERAAEAIVHIEDRLGLEATEEFTRLRDVHDALLEMSDAHPTAGHGQPLEDGDAADREASPGGSADQLADADLEPRPVGFDALPNGIPATMGPFVLTWATMAGDTVHRARWTDTDLEDGVQVRYHADRGEWVVCEYRAGDWRESGEYDNLPGAVGKASHLARQRGDSLPKVTKTIEALAEEADGYLNDEEGPDWPRRDAGSDKDASDEPAPGAWEVSFGSNASRKTVWTLEREDAKNLRVEAHHSASYYRDKRGKVYLTMPRRRSENGAGFESRQTLLLGRVPNWNKTQEDLLRRKARDAAIAWMEVWPYGPPADVLEAWDGPMEVVDGSEMGDDPLDDVALDPSQDLTAEVRGRVKAHAEAGRLEELLSSLEKAGLEYDPEAFNEAGIDTVEEFLGHGEGHGHFQNVEGVGPKGSERLEAALPLVEAGLADREATGLYEEGERVHHAEKGAGTVQKAAPGARDTFLVDYDDAGDVWTSAGLLEPLEEARGTKAPDPDEYEPTTSLEEMTGGASSSDDDEPVLSQDEQASLDGSRVNEQAEFAGAPEAPDGDPEHLEEAASEFGVDDRESADRGAGGETDSEAQTLGEATGGTDAPDDAGQGQLSGYDGPPRNDDED